MSQLVKCPCCETELPAGHKARLGILINDLASAGANVVEAIQRFAGLSERNPLYAPRKRRVELEIANRDAIEKQLLAESKP